MRTEKSDELYQKRIKDNLSRIVRHPCESRDLLHVKKIPHPSYAQRASADRQVRDDVLTKLKLSTTAIFHYYKDLELLELRLLQHFPAFSDMFDLVLLSIY